MYKTNVRNGKTSSPYKPYRERGKVRAAQDKTIAKPLSEGEAACLKQANKEAGKANKVEPRRDNFRP